MHGTDILIFVGIASAGTLVMFALAIWGIPANERRLARRNQFDLPADDRSRMRDALWSATAAPEDCPHDDVVEDWSESLETWNKTIMNPPPGVILDQGGVCRKCGARFVRHGSPYAWTDWMLDPTE